MRLYLEKTYPEKGWWSGSKCKPWGQTPVLKKRKKSLRKQTTKKALKSNEKLENFSKETNYIAKNQMEILKLKNTS
jgi:hypothetical protein